MIYKSAQLHKTQTRGGQPNKVTWYVMRTYPNLAGNTNQENKCPGPGQALSLGFLNSQARLRLTLGPPLSRAELSSNGPGLSGPWVWGPTQHITTYWCRWTLRNLKPSSAHGNPFWSRLYACKCLFLSVQNGPNALEWPFFLHFAFLHLFLHSDLHHLQNASSFSSHLRKIVLSSRVFTELMVGLQTIDDYLRDYHTQTSPMFHLRISHGISFRLIISA